MFFIFLSFINIFQKNNSKDKPKINSIQTALNSIGSYMNFEVNQRDEGRIKKIKVIESNDFIFFQNCSNPMHKSILLLVVMHAYVSVTSISEKEMNYRGNYNGSCSSTVYKSHVKMTF